MNGYKKKPNKVIFYQIPSKSKRGKRYTVRLMADGEIRCSCPQFVFRRNCKHLTKKCPHCEKIKRVDEFYKYRSGIQCWCKECQGKRYRENKDYRDLKRAGVKKYRKTEEFRKSHNKYSKTYYRKRDKQKIKANALLGTAVKSGKIKRQPCEVCGDKKSEAHHPDYSKPLEVKWLCHKHHRILEKRWLLTENDL